MLMLSLRRKATMVAVGTAIVGSIALATPAQAAYLGWVSTYGYGGGNYDRGFYECKQRYPATKSVSRISSERYYDTIRYNWACHS
jgi:hypothetical protein